jgi:uncharacterized membrane protein
VSTTVFVLTLLLAVAFITASSSQLPPVVASHFDAAGNPNSFMARTDYIHFLLWIGVAVPMALVAVLTFVNSRKIKLKLPNSDYWMAPARIAETRAFLVGHSVWFGTIFVAMICYVNWLVLKAHQVAPPHLAAGLVVAGLVIFVVLAGGWAMVLLFAFRRPRR